MMINVFIIGSKGIPAKYGGFETFVEKLTLNKKSNDIKYFVSCMGDNEIYEHNNATCFSIKLKKDNAFSRMKSVSKSLSWVESYLKSNKSGDKNIVYILGCRIGLLIKKHARALHKLNCKIVVNPDGLEWKRDKWNKWQKKVLLYSEHKLIKNSDYIVCDSLGIKDYIEEKYPFFDKNKITYIAYGSDIVKSDISIDKATEWLKRFNCEPHNYYLIVGRFVAENNYELIIREFLKSKTDKKLLIITNVQENKFYQYLKKKLAFENDERIIFAGTLYNENILKKIRELAFAYIHGHSVGGTNPSLLEALSYSMVNILYDVSFNKEVGQNQCLYFSNQEGSLLSIINSLDNKTNYDKYHDSFCSVDIIKNRYSWDYIVNLYEDFFKNNC